MCLNFQVFYIYIIINVIYISIRVLNISKKRVRAYLFKFTPISFGK